jgi:Mn-dependent DtxR family transcriptional regulator
MTREEVKITVFEALSEYFDQERTVSVSEASRMLKKTRPTVYGMISRGELKKNDNGIFLNSIRKAQLRTLKSS